MLNLRGSEEDRREEREREILLFVEVSVDMRVSGRERDVRIAAVVLSIDVSAARNWRRGEESEVDVER
jgi:hypothetical protein